MQYTTTDDPNTASLGQFKVYIYFFDVNKTNTKTNPWQFLSHNPSALSHTLPFSLYEEPAYLHEFEQETWLDGDSEVVPGGVFARNGRQEGVPDGTRSFHSLL